MLKLLLTYDDRYSRLIVSAWGFQAAKAPFLKDLMMANLVVVTKVWIEAEDLVLATLALNGCGTKMLKDTHPYDMYCFKKEIGFNITELNRLYKNFPRTIVAYPDGDDFIRNPLV